MRTARKITVSALILSLVATLVWARPALAAVSNDPNYTAALLTSGLLGPANGVVFRASTNDVLVSEYIGNKVTKVDATSGAKSTFALVPFPDEMAINSTGDVFVKEHPAGPIHRFSSSGAALSPATFAAPCTGPTGVAFDSADNFYVACSASGTIYRFAAGNFTTSTVFASGFPSLEGMDFSPGGALFVTDFVNGRIYQVTPGGMTLAAHTQWASGLSEPLNVGFDSLSGNLFASDTDKVVRITAPNVVTTFASGFTPTPGGGTYDLDFDSKGCLYVDDFTKGELWKFCPKVDQPIRATPTMFSGTEGQPLVNQLVAKFFDPDPASTAAEYSATINWGDASSSPPPPVTITQTGSSMSGNTFEVRGDHTYQEEATYSVKVTITDVDTKTSMSVISTATIGDAALVKAACAMPPVTTQHYNGPTATFEDQNSFATSADFTGTTINWGDGNTTAGTVSGSGNGPYTVNGDHTYTSTGPFTVTTTIKDDGGSTTVATCTVVVFAFATGNGATFVIGDIEAGIGNPETWWSSQWAKINLMTGGPAPASMKGFAGFEDMPLPNPLPPLSSLCGMSYTTDTGNSTPPPPSVPEFMAVIASSHITQSGSVITGDIKQLVVVHNNPGYAPDPGHPGTGTEVIPICMAP
jgi:sugar lactone lactonase YvrE